MKEIQLTQGKVALVDDDDYEWLSQYKWYYMSRGKHSNSPGYAARHSSKKTIYMHLAIMNAPNGIEVDHRFGDSLDNQKENLRFCTDAENSKNKHKRTESQSKYKGLCRPKNRNKWQVQVYVNGKKHHVGMFDDEIEAAKAYDAAARQYYGEFAATNFED